jgi:hypothetical protein
VKETGMKRAFQLAIGFTAVAVSLTATTAPVAAAGAAARAAEANSAPGGTRLWVARFSASTGHYANDSGVATSPNHAVVYVTGASGSYVSDRPEPAYVTVAYDARTGAQLWEATYTATHHPAWGFGGFPKIAVSPNGAEVFLAGNIPTGEKRPDNNAYLMIAYSAATGAQLWATEPVAGGALNSPVVATAAAVYASGTSTGHGRSSYLTVAVDPANGHLLWQATTPLPAEASAVSLAVSPDGSGVFAGSSLGVAAYNAATGAAMWFDPYKFQEGRSTDLAVSPDSGMVYSAGGSMAGGEEHFVITAYQAGTGKQLWSEVYRATGQAASIGGPVAVSPDGTEVFITGFTYPSGSCCVASFETIAYSATTGSRLWMASGPGPAKSLNSPVGITVSPDSSEVFVLNATTGPDNPEYGIVARSTATGAVLWSENYPNGVDSDPTQMALSPDGTKLFVTGIGDANQQATSYLTVAYHT